MFRGCLKMPRLLRDIAILIVAVFLIIAFLFALGPDQTVNNVVKVPTYFRGQRLTETNFHGPTNDRQRAVVAAFKHAWKGYKEFAWGHDNLRPISMSSSDWFGLGLTIVDSLSTIIVMDLQDQLKEATEWVKNELHVDVDRKVSVFEVTIRALGGLLSAYHLSGEQIFLTKANDLGGRLLKSFTSSGSGIPYPWINLNSLDIREDSITSIAEAGSLQLEFRALAYSAKNKTFEEVVDKSNQAIHNLPKMDGLAHADINIEQAMFANSYQANIGAGGRTDSYYEYLLKQWIQIGKPKNHPLIVDYSNAIDGMLQHLVRRTGDGRHVIIGELNSGVFNPKLEHLTCFLPGTLLLGYVNGLPEFHKKLALDLLESCYTTYMITKTHLAPEQTYFEVVKPTGEISDIYGQGFSLLRPEFVESLYYFWALTGNSTYQDMGWEIFEAVEKYAKVEHGYTSLQNVQSKNPSGMDNMETFFLSETLKYFYLLFSDDRKLINLDKFVFNTEAHPLPIL